MNGVATQSLRERDDRKEKFCILYPKDISLYAKGFNLSRFFSNRGNVKAYPVMDFLKPL